MSGSGINLNFSLELDVDALVAEVDTVMKSAISQTAQPLKSFLIERASETLDTSLQIWKDGIQVREVSQDSYMIIMSGKLSGMIEDGFAGEELKRILLEGARAQFNATQSEKGSKFVDVPFGISNEKMKKGKVEGVSLSQFRDAKQVSAQFQQTRGGVVSPAEAMTKTVKVKKVKDGKNITEKFLHSEGEGTKLGFMTIRRVSEKSSLKGFAGAKIFNRDTEIETFISTQFGVIFQRLI